MRDYERNIRLSLALSWLIYRINPPILRDIFMSSFDLFDTRSELIGMLAGDFYERRSLLSPLRRVQLVYGCLCFSQLGLRLLPPHHRLAPKAGKHFAVMGGVGAETGD